MELREALDQIADIRLRLAESEVFRGYRALPVAVSGFLALAAGRVQPFIVPDPAENVRAYVLFWSAIAGLSVAVAAITIVLRDRLAGPSHTRMLTWIAIRQFLPCLLSGAAVTVAMVRLAPESAWLLPGLWQLFFAQGVFASCRILPRAVYLAAGFYCLSGALNFFLWNDAYRFSPWAMALPFGVGQLLVASILYWTLERRHAAQAETEF